MIGGFISTSIKNRALILGDLWLNYRQDENFEDDLMGFFQYNDVALPLAFILAEGIAKGTKKSESLINETFDLLLAGWSLEDPKDGWKNLDQMLEHASWHAWPW